MARLDTNVILRHLTQEPIDQAQQVAVLFQAVASGDESVLVEEVVVAEAVWTLASHYQVDRTEIARSLGDMLADEGIRAADKQSLQLALVLYGERNLDFADALLAAKALQSGDPVIYSFDRDFDRIAGVVRREP